MMSRPLFDLLKKGIPFVWTDITETAFQQLKLALQQAPVLPLLDFKKPFVLETDASDVGFGAVLMQDHHPIAYLSKAKVGETRHCPPMKRNVWPSFLQLRNGNIICSIVSSLSE